MKRSKADAQPQDGKEVNRYERERASFTQKVLEDFVFLGCRLGDSRNVSAHLLICDADGLLAFPAPAEPWGQDKRRLGPIGLPTVLKFHCGADAHHGMTISLYGERMALKVVRQPAIMQDLWIKDGGCCFAVALPGGLALPTVLLIGAGQEEPLGQDHEGAVLLLASILAYSLSHIDAICHYVDASSINLGIALKSVRQQQGLSQESLAHSIPTSRIALSKWEAGGQHPSKGPLYRWCQPLGVLSPSTNRIIEVHDITPSLMELLRAEPARLRQLSPEQFEHLVAERLDRMGYEVRLTGACQRKDGGVDLIAMPRIAGPASFLIAGQVKHHGGRDKTGRQEVDRLLAWKDSQFRLGLLVTNTAFTRDARWLASQPSNVVFLRLRDFEDLKRWIHNDFTAPDEFRELPYEITLAPGIVVPVSRPLLPNSSKIWPMHRERMEDSDKL